MAQVESDLKKWLLSLDVEERIEFIKQLWPINFRFALILVQASQLPRKELDKIFRYCLREGHHNTAQELIKRFIPMLGENKFWRIASQENTPLQCETFLIITVMVAWMQNPMVKPMLLSKRLTTSND